MNFQLYVLQQGMGVQTLQLLHVRIANETGTSLFLFIVL